MILEVFLQSVQSKVYSYVKNNTCTHCVHIPNSIYSLKIIVSVRDRLEGGAIRERDDNQPALLFNINTGRHK